jgi:hypothetical protein
LVLRLLVFACALAAMTASGIFAAVAIGEEVTTPPAEETPTGEAVSEPVRPPVKETVETVTTPKKEPPATAEPTPTTTTSTSETPAGSGGSSGSSATSPAPVKIAPGPTQTSTPKTHSGGEGGSSVHHGSGLAGAATDSNGTAHTAAGGQSHGASEVLGTSATSEPESSATPRSAEGTEPAGSTEPQAHGEAAHQNGGRPAVAKLGDSQPVEVAPKAPAPSSPLTTVGHVLSRPFSEPTSPSAILIDLAILLGGAALLTVVWLEVGGGVSRWRLGELLDLARRGRSAE